MYKDNIAHIRESSSLFLCVFAADYAGFYYGADHPMKPPRIAMTHDLVLGYGLHEHLDVYVRCCYCFQKTSLTPSSIN